jgi:hypothetical protein
MCCGDEACSREVSIPRIAKWYDNSAGAISLRFDDCLESHVKTVIPYLNNFNIKATFMVSPGRSNYTRNKNFWEHDVPAMGHFLGNHTMNHHGAKNVTEADYEIGMPSKIIWRLYPDKSKLIVFASGGGELWAGKTWQHADREIKAVLDQYYLIDLYDGNHPSHLCSSDTTLQQLSDLLFTAKAQKRHQAFHFHTIGSPSFKDRVMQVLGSKNLSCSYDTFKSFVEMLNSYNGAFWIAPLVSVLKYETEFNAAEIVLLSRKQNRQTVQLNISTDYSLYDHPLTLIIPSYDSRAVHKVLQNNEDVAFTCSSPQECLAKIAPVSSTITIIY